MMIDTAEYRLCSLMMTGTVGVQLCSLMITGTAGVQLCSLMITCTAGVRCEQNLQEQVRMECRALCCTLEPATRYMPHVKFCAGHYAARWSKPLGTCIPARVAMCGFMAVYDYIGYISHYSLGMVTRTSLTLYLQRRYLIYTILHCAYSGNV